MSDIERQLWLKVNKNDPSGCWTWEGWLTKDGYARLSWGGKIWSPHRLVLSFSGVDIPKGMCVDHLCRNRSCCNPDHLEVVTPQTNVQRGLLGDLYTHCKKGHEMSGANVLIIKREDGHQRRCRECNLVKQKEYREANPELMSELKKRWNASNRGKINQCQRDRRAKTKKESNL